MKTYELSEFPKFIIDMIISYLNFVASGNLSLVSKEWKSKILNHRRFSNLTHRDLLQISKFYSRIDDINQSIENIYQTTTFSYRYGATGLHKFFLIND